MNKSKKRIDYELNPKLCLECKSELDFSIRNLQSFCSHSCSATYNNNKRGNNFRTEESKKVTSKSLIKNYNSSPTIEIICKLCGEVFLHKNSRKQFCLNCEGKYLNRCVICSLSFISKNERQTCSEKCYSILLSSQLKDKYNNGTRTIAVGVGFSKWIEVNTSVGTFKVNGSYEFRMIQILEKWKENGQIKDWEYTNDRVQYQKIGEKSKSNYLLDFKVFRNNNSFYYIETKGWYDANDFVKWNIVRKLGFELEIWFEKEIIEEEKLNMVSQV
jgi:predicted nucleic acid-binding Zn ribbon protein